MREISLCMIVKNEEDVIGRCLESVKDIADEIIIVDTGSTDRTKEIVSQYTDKIFDFEWIDDFSKARNFSFSKATKDYILWLDADDVILEKDYQKFMELKKNIDINVDIYMMKYNYITDKEGNPTLVQNRARLLKREKNYQWVSAIHEVIIPEGNIENVEIAITHKKEKIKDSNRNIRILKKMIENGEKLDTRQEYCFPRELFGLQRYEEAKEEYKRFISKYETNYDKERAFLYPAILELSDCYKHLGNSEDCLECLFTILKHEIPAPECCCKIGSVFLEKKEYEIAKFWFEMALQNNEKLKESVNIDYNEFIPYLNLCVCYFWLGDMKKSNEYNEKAGKIKPNDEIYLKNKECFTEK